MPHIMTSLKALYDCKYKHTRLLFEQSSSYILLNSDLKKAGKLYVFMWTVLRYIWVIKLGAFVRHYDTQPIPYFYKNFHNSTFNKVLCIDTQR
jgi:hypothetical protein